MSDYSHDGFDDDNDNKSLLRLMIELRSVKDFKQSCNLFTQYQVTLSGKTHTFKSHPPTTVGAGREIQLQNSFASFSF